jgi:hypothetical protein
MDGCGIRTSRCNLPTQRESELRTPCLWAKEAEFFFDPITDDELKGRLLQRDRRLKWLQFAVAEDFGLSIIRLPDVIKLDIVRTDRIKRTISTFNIRYGELPETGF